MCTPTEKVLEAKEAPVVESSIGHRLQQPGLLANYYGNSERGNRQASESAHGPGVPTILRQEGYG